MTHHGEYLQLFGDMYVRQLSQCTELYGMVAATAADADRKHVIAQNCIDSRRAFHTVLSLNKVPTVISDSTA